MDREPTDVSGLVEKMLRTTTFGDGVRVTVDDGLENPIADVDGGQIIQVLTNLITNAQHAMPGGGELLIKLEDGPDTVTIIVSDTGEGVAPENLGRVFDPFFTTKQVGMGTGLGLAVTHGIVKMHKGQIGVKSNADPAAGPIGTTFTITLPRHKEETGPVGGMTT